MSLTLADIDAKIQALLDNQQVNRSEGDVSIDAGDKIRQLLEVRKHLIENGQDAEISEMTFDIGINEFGGKD